MHRDDIIHLLEDRRPEQMIIRTAYGETFERPRRVEVRYDDDMGRERTVAIETADGILCIRPLDAIIAVVDAL
jgi:hypothetical protein